MTNGERLRSMSDEELAEFLKNAEIGELVPGFCGSLCWTRLNAPCREDGPGWCIWHDKEHNDRGAWLWWLGQEVQ